MKKKQSTVDFGVKRHLKSKVICVFIQFFALFALANCYACDTHDEWLTGKYETNNAKEGKRPKKWPNGIVPFKFDSYLTETEKDIALKAFGEFEQKTCIRFQPWMKGTKDYVSIQVVNSANFCGNAYVCKTGGEQFIKIGKQCWTIASIIHQLGHTLCLGHEHQRQDRDNYLTFQNCSNKPDKIDSLYDSKGFFDYASQMHPPCKSCIGVWPPVPNSDVVCGYERTPGLSILDADTINSLYNCKGCHRHRWVPAALLTLEDKANMHNFGYETLDGSPLYACRVWHKGEVSSGVYSELNKTCLISFYMRRYEEKEHVEVLTIPRGVETNCGKYTLVDGNVAVYSNVVPVGTIIYKHNWTSVVAYDSRPGERGIGKVWWKDVNGFQTPAEFFYDRSSEYQVLTCSVDAKCIPGKSGRKAEEPIETTISALNLNDGETETALFAMNSPPYDSTAISTGIFNLQTTTGFSSYNSNGSSTVTREVIVPKNSLPSLSNTQNGTFVGNNRTKQSNSSGIDDDVSTDIDTSTVTREVIVPTNSSSSLPNTQNGTFAGNNRANQSNLSGIDDGVSTDIDTSTVTREVIVPTNSLPLLSNTQNGTFAGNNPTNQSNSSGVDDDVSTGMDTLTVPREVIVPINSLPPLSNTQNGTFAANNRTNQSNSSGIDDNVSTGMDTIFILLIIFLPLLLILSLITLCHIRRLRKANEILSEVDIIQFQEGTLSTEVEEERTGNTFDRDGIRGLKFNSEYELKKEQISIDTNRILGAGKFGVVYKGMVDETEAAIKMPNDNCTKLTFKTFLSEVTILCYLGRHKHILKFIGAYVAEIRYGILHIATELCSNGSLHTFLRKKKHVIQNKDHTAPGLLEEEEIVCFSELCSFSFQIARGMEYIAKKRIVHGDISTRNVFLGEGNVCKIGDFGLSRKLEEYEIYVKQSQEPIPWKWWAYESLAKKEFTCKSDVWGYGVTIWEIFSLGQTPYAGLNWTPQFLAELENGMRLPQPLFASPEIYGQLQDCWKLDPDVRTTCKNMARFFMNLCNTEYICLDELPGDEEQNNMCTSSM